MSHLVSQLRFVITIGLLGMLAVFAIQNIAEVELQFMHWTFQSRRIVVIGISLIVGLIIGWVIGHGSGQR